MFGSVVLDVAIGMAFVYLLMSLIASVMQEIVAAFLQLRPANLLRGVRSLFSGDSLWGKDLVDSLYTHGLVRGLYSDPEEDLKERQPPAAPGVGETPVPPRPASATSLRVRMVEAARAWLMTSFTRFTSEKGVRGVSPKALLPAYIPSRTFALAMVDILNRQNASGPAMMRSITQSLAEHHLLYQSNKAGEAMYALALDANGDLQAFKKNLEAWYNDSMDRASGWYKRHIQRILLWLGVLLAVLFNVDSVRVAQTLWFDRDSRQAMVNAADAYVKKHPDPAVDAAHASEAAAAQKDPASSARDLKSKLTESAGAFNQATNSALLPVGWKHSPLGYVKDGWRYAFVESKPEAGIVFLTLWRCVELLLGWLITGMAISLGAPFWFDTLNKFMVVRSTVKPQEKSQTEGSKD